MKDEDRVRRWLLDLDRTLAEASLLIQRGRQEFDSDPAMPLAFEALCNRVGDLAKKLTFAAPDRFAETHWGQAARARDFVVHHYNRVDEAVLWNTVAVNFPELAEQVRVRLLEGEQQVSPRSRDFLPE